MERHLTILFAKRSRALSGSKLSPVLVPRPHLLLRHNLHRRHLLQRQLLHRHHRCSLLHRHLRLLTSRLRLRCKDFSQPRLHRHRQPLRLLVQQFHLYNRVHRLRRWNQAASRWEAFWAISPRHRRRHQLLLSNLWRRQLVERVILMPISILVISTMLLRSNKPPQAEPCRAVPVWTQAETLMQHGVIWTLFSPLKVNHWRLKMLLLLRRFISRWKPLRWLHSYSSRPLLRHRLCHQ